MCFYLDLAVNNDTEYKTWLWIVSMPWMSKQTMPSDDVDKSVQKSLDVMLPLLKPLVNDRITSGCLRALLLFSDHIAGKWRVQVLRSVCVSKDRKSTKYRYLKTIFTPC